MNSAFNRAFRTGLRAHLLALLTSASVVCAQEATNDPLLDTESEEEAVSAVTFIGDLWMNQDHVSGLPNARPDLDRTRGRLRLGAIWGIAPAWELTGAVRLALGSDSNDDNVRNNDNERSDDFGLDQIFVRWRYNEDASLLFGQMPFPLDLSPMIWDPDLRPAGVALDHSFALGDFDRLHLVAGYFAGEHLYDDSSRIGAAQLVMNWHEGAPTRASAMLSWLDFSQIDELAQEGLGRTNTIVSGELANDYRLLDLQLSGRVQVANWPIELRTNLLRNLGADTKRDAWRASVTVGDHLQPRGVEFGYAMQRVERDAVLAAFNSDDWWFHSNMRGQLAWVAYGFDASWSMRLAAFRELRDGLSEHTHRLFLTLDGSW